MALTVLLAVLAAAGGARAAQQAVSGFGWKHHRSHVHPHSFKVTGRLMAPVPMGGSVPLDLRLANPHPYSLRISKLTVNVFVDPTHTAAGCVRGRDFRSIPMPPTAYPIRLRPHKSLKLTQLGVRVLPQIGLSNLPLNQDACKGARLTLKFGGRARRWSTGTTR